MRAIFESLFDIGYLVAIFTLGVLILRSGPARAGDITAQLAGWIAVILGFGDSFHLIARVVALNTTGGMADHAVALGYGKLVTALTMTAFYVLVYLLALRRWPTPREQADTAAYRPLGAQPAVTALVGLAAIVHVLLVLLPQNEIFTADPPVSWGIVRNIPFTVLGVVIVIELARRARHDRYYRFAWLAVTLSFAFYLPVVLWAHTHDAIGLLMIPKTLAYVWLVVMGFRAYVRPGPVRAG